MAILDKMLANRRMNSSEYIEVTLRISPFSETNAEIAEAEMVSLSYEAFMSEGETLKAYIPRNLYDPRKLKLILYPLPFRTDFSANLIPPQNWNAGWESEFAPVVIDGKVTVCSPERPAAKRTRFNIKIRPNMAFGTAHHTTTRMMISQMLSSEALIRGGVVMDIGCGTGVLAILAVKMGAAKAYGIDIDAVAAQSAFDNARMNRVGRKVETYCGDSSLLQMGKYDLLLANIHKNVIIDNMKVFSMSVKKGGRLFFSGFYDEDCADLVEAASSCGLSLCSERHEDGWALLELEKI